jgi:hypothetical protein
MWPFKPKGKPTRHADEPHDINLERIQHLRDVLPLGTTFDYLGCTLRVTGHWTYTMSQFDVYSIPKLQCDYADVHGVIRTIAFTYVEAMVIVDTCR